MRPERPDRCTLLIMDSRSALTLSIGVLGGLAVAVTAEVITVPIWVVSTWASSFFVGGGASGGRVTVEQHRRRDHRLGSCTPAT